MSARICSKSGCSLEPVDGQRYCLRCRRQAQKEYRDRKAAELESLRNERAARLAREREEERAHA